MEETLRIAIHEALVSMGAGDVMFAVEWPADFAHGDFATNAALAASKTLGRAPREIADELVALLKKSLGDDVASIEAAGPGFVNITLSRSRVTEALSSALDPEWGKGSARAGERVAFEYSCPNPFKEMHIGHLMNTVIGEAASRLVENQGARVLRDSYGGDIGPHVARGMWGLSDMGVIEPTSASEIGKAYEHGSRAYEESGKAKAEIDALNVALYEALAKEPQQWNEEERVRMELWRKGREVALSAFREIYALLDTHFDYYLFESETSPIGMSIVKEYLAKGVFEESEGAVIYAGEKKGLHTLVFITSRGTPTYETKDVGLAFLKEEKIPNDSSYIVTGIEQVGHFKVFLAALEEIAPEVALKTHHIPHGLLQLTTGKMASRKGNVVTAAGMIETVLAMALEKNEDPLVAESVAVGALKYMILRSAPGSSVIFDPEKALALDGDSGPYLQYALVRAKSVIAQSEVVAEKENAPPETYDIERLLIRFPEVARRAEAMIAPHAIAQYLTTLASAWNSFYATERIRGGEHETYKLLVAQTFVTTMENGLALLGIPVPERM